MASTLAMAVDTIHSLQATYKAIHRIAISMWTSEKDSELRNFYASLMAYFAIIYDHISRIGASAAAAGRDTKLFSIVLGLTQPIFTPYFLNLPTRARMRELGQIQQKIQNIRDNDMNIEIIRSCLGFGVTLEEREGFVKSLAACEDALRTRYPEDPSQWDSEDFAPHIKISEPSYAVWNAAQSIFNALVACKNCPCTPTHDFGALLCLGTYRKPVAESDMETDDVIDFDMFLSMQQEWQEAHIQTAKERAVQFEVNQAAQSGTRKRGPRINIMKVKRLCEPIARIKTMAAYRLELKVARDQLFKLQSERSNSLIDKSKSPVSLQQFLREKSGSFTERTRRILAVILSSAVFHLHDTPWLQPTWNSSNVLFLRTASSAVPLRPFIKTQLSIPQNNLMNDADSGHELGQGAYHTGGINSEDLDPDDIDPDDLDPDDLDPDDLLRHQCPILVTLAVMLMEVYFVTPFDILAKRYEVDLGSDVESSNCTRYIDVNVVFEKCRSEIPDNSQFYLAVDHCLDPKLWEDEYGKKLDNQTMRTRIYQEVVLPLETELGQAYGSISIDDLDRFAQKVDFSSWDQTIHAWNQRTEKLQADEVASIQLSRANSVSPRPMMAQAYPRSYTPQGHHQQPCGSETDLLNKGSELNHGIKRCQASAPELSRSPSELVGEAILSDYMASSISEPRGRWEYTVGILCALPKELFAVRALFDAKHNSLMHLPGDSNNYALGTMNKHLVVAACLPSGEYGTNAAADSASNMKRSFTNIKFCLLVGIGGGAPSDENDIRLGDVVVSLPTARFPGVIQYDRGKEVEGDTFELTGSLQPPPRCLMTAISGLRSNPDLPSNPLQLYLEDIIQRVPDPFKLKYQHPGQDQDELFRHACSACRNYGKCANREDHVQHRHRRPTDHPQIHYGLIASGNRVMKDAKTRDKWAQEYGILCFEMEAAGVMNTFPCLVIRGICDYSDSYKHKAWQEYAAATAAAYAKLLLGEVVPSDSSWERFGAAQTGSHFDHEGLEEPPGKRQRF